MTFVEVVPASSLDVTSSPVPSTSRYTSTYDNSLQTVSSATVAWTSVPDMTACAPATISWNYSGPEQQLVVSAYPGRNLSVLVNATAETHTLSPVQLVPGSYTMTIRVSQDLDPVAHHTQFFVNGTNTSCFPHLTTVAPRATTTDTSSSNNGPLVGGIAVGVGGAVTLLAVGFYFRLAVMRLFRRRGSNAREADPEIPGPAYESQWGALHSRTISDAGHSHDSERKLLDSLSVGPTPEMRTNALPTSQGTTPRLEPNRRPLSSTQEVSTAPLRIVKRSPPLPRLEPNRRKPSIATTVALELAPSKDQPGPSAPPGPAAVPALKVDLETEFRPIPRPTPIAAPLLKAPKPPRRSTIRQSGISALTSASTTLSDMPLLHPGPHGPVQVELQRVHALAKLDAIMDHPPLPTATPPPPSRTPSPSQSSTMTVAAAPQVPPVNRSPTSPTPCSPLSPFLHRMSAQQQPLSRSGSGRSRIAGRKPVPPLDPSATPAPSDVGSSIMWTRRSSYASTYAAWNGRGSPVPSSSTSQMYRTRDSVWSGSLTGSEWTWTRPMEDWEKEQMRVLAVVNPDLENDAVGTRPSGSAGSVSGARGIMRHHSFGDMRAMKTVIPDVPPMPDRKGTR